MNIKYNRVGFAQSLNGAQDKAYARLTRATAHAASAPVRTTTDRYVKLAKVVTLNSIRRYQFFRPEQSTITRAFTIDAVVSAIRSSRGLSILPLGAPFALVSMAAYLVLGTGEKVSWAAHDSHPIVLSAAVLTQHGILGLSVIAAFQAGRSLEKAGFGALAHAAFAAATCFCYAVESLRAALICASFVLQVPYTALATLLCLGYAGLSAAYTNSLSPQKNVWDASDIFDDAQATMT